jgi:CMP/dCMP kinase
VSHAQAVILWELPACHVGARDRELPCRAYAPNHIPNFDPLRHGLNNKEKLREETVRLLLSGLSGTGSTTAAKRIAAHLGLTYVYGGRIFRDLAVERGISLEELAESLEADQETEREIDRRLIDAGLGDEALVEGRTIGWIFPRDVPALRVWLTCDLEERLRRVEARENHPRSRENLLRREAADNHRYRLLYGIEENDFSPFDLVIDTTTLPVEEVVDRIESYVRSRVPDTMTPA